MAVLPLPTYWLIDIGAVVILAVIAIGLIREVRTGRMDFPGHRIRKMMQKKGGGENTLLGITSLLTTSGSVFLQDVLGSRVLRTCSRGKWAAHLLVFWGFAFAALATTLAYFMKPEGTILPLENPVKIFGNLGGILLMIGCVGMFAVRFQETGSRWEINRSDIFLLLLLLTAATGFAVEVAIYAYGRTGLVTAAAYWAHIALLIGLLITSPITKFVHAIYKPYWLIHDHLEVRFLTKQKEDGTGSG